MQIHKLKKVVLETGACIIKVGDHSFPVVSQEYQDKKEWFIKGGYTLESNMQPMTLICGRLEKDVAITINRPVAVNGEKLDTPDPTATIENYQNEERTFVFYHLPTKKYTGHELKRKELTAYASAMFESFKKETGEEAKREDFLIAIIDWEKKNISFESFE